MMHASIACAVAPESGAAAPAHYPLKIGTGFQVDRGSDIFREYCTAYGYRATSALGTEKGPLTLLTEKIFDEDGNAFIRGSFTLDFAKSAYSASEKSVAVEIDLDGKTHALPSADIDVAVLTFLTTRFPVELLNDIATAQNMKIYILDAKAKTRTLFATTDMSTGRDAIPAFATCTTSLSSFATRLPGKWTVEHGENVCIATSTVRQSATPLKYGAAMVTSAEKGKDYPVILFFTEPKSQAPMRFTKPTVRIAGTAYAATYKFSESELYEHAFLLPSAVLGKFGPGVKFAVEDGGKEIMSGTDIFPKFALQALARCAASSHDPG